MGSGFESQGAHFKGNPADSSESAGFLRSLNKYSFVVRGVYILFAPAGDPSSQSSDTLMSRQRIYTPLCVSVFGVRFGPVGVAVDVRWFSTCAPCLANWGGGGLSPFSVLRDGWCFVCGRGSCRGLACCMVAGCLGWCAVFSGSALRVSHGRSPQRSKEGRSVRVTGAPA